MERCFQYIKGEISMSRAWFPVAGVLGLIGLVPGMPTMLFTGMAVISGVAGYVFRQAEMREDTDEVEQNKAPEEPSDPDTLTVDDVADLSAVTMLLSYPLLTMVDADDGGPLARRITSERKEVSQALGFVLPGVRVRDDLALQANEYQIKVGQPLSPKTRFILTINLQFKVRTRGSKSSAWMSKTPPSESKLHGSSQSAN